MIVQIVVQLNPPLRQAAVTLGASGGQHSDGETLKANSGNDYREVVTRKLAVLNPFEKPRNCTQLLYMARPGNVSKIIDIAEAYHGKVTK